MAVLTPGTSGSTIPSSCSAISDPEPHMYSRLYQIRKHPFQRHYEVLSEAGQVQYRADITSFFSRKPDIALLAGNSSRAPVVATCSFPLLSGDLKVCLGDPDDHQNAQWEDMLKQGLSGSAYRWQMSAQFTDGYMATNPAGKRRAFVWKRTRNVGVSGAKPPTWSLRNWKLVDEETRDILAVFMSEWSFQDRGRLQMRTPCDKDFETMALVQTISLYEKARRRENRKKV